jgi:hypothetical protein
MSMRMICSTVSFGRQVTGRNLSGARIVHAQKQTMNVYDLFPTRFIAATDLNGKSFTLTIRSVTLEDMQSHDQKTVTKPCLWFTNATKGMVLNKTNTMIIADMYGPETDDWAGKKIIIYATKVRAFGKLEEAVRVREEVPPEPKPPTQAAQVEEPSGLDDDEDSLDITLDPETGEIIDGDVLFAPAEPSNGKQPGTLSQAQLTKIHVLGADVHGSEWPRFRPGMVDDASNGRVKSSKDLSREEASVLINNLELKLKAKHARNGVAA